MAGSIYWCHLVTTAASNASGLCCNPCCLLPSTSLPLLSPSRSVACSSALSLSPSLVYLGKWDSPLPHFISFPFYSPRISLSCSGLPLLPSLSLSPFRFVCVRLFWLVGIGNRADLRNRKGRKRPPASSPEAEVDYHCPSHPPLRSSTVHATAYVFRVSFQFPFIRCWLAWRQ